MNKKFMNALLFSAALLSSGAIVTSCDDYDDDINSLNERVDGLAADLAKLQQDFGALSYVTGVTFADGTLTVTTTGETKTYKIPDNDTNTTYSLAGSIDGNNLILTLTPNNGQAQNVTIQLPEVTVPEAFDPAKLKVVDGVVYYGDTKTEVTIPAAPGMTLVEIKDSVGDVVGYSITYGDKTTQLMIAEAKLKSLVFKPQAYYNGIEAMKAPVLSYIALNLKDVNANDDFADDAPTSNNGNHKEVTPNLVAYYHVNPSNINPNAIKKENLKFLVEETEVIARSAKDGVVVPTILDSELSNGILTVKAHLTEGMIKNPGQNGDLITTMALQVGTRGEKGDTLVTSDYAAVVKSEWSNFALANAKDEDGFHKVHWYTTAEEAIEADADIKVKWNSEGVDLAEYVQTHYKNVREHTNDQILDKNAKEKTANNYGLKYKYELVGYYQGQNETSESVHANWTAEGSSVLRPQMPKNGELAGMNGEQNRATIGREPLVRVVLQDTVSKANVAVGYIKLQIVDTEAENQTTVIPEFSRNTNYTVNCSDQDLYQQLTWNEVEEQIIAVLGGGLTKEEFEDQYKLDVVAEGSSEAKQFTTTGKDAVEVTNRLGVVEITTADDDPDMTEVLKWTLRANETYEQFVAEPSAVVNVRFVKDNGNGTFHYVYVTFNWTPKVRNVKPEGQVSNEAKIAELWFERGNNKSKTGYDEVHFNVKVPASTTEDATACTYTKKVFEVFDKSKDLITGVNAVYVDFQNDKLAKNVKFITPRVTAVVGNSGTAYTLGVSTDGTKLMASAGNTFVEATASAIAIVANNVVTYQENTVAKDLLNYADHKELADGQTLTGRMALVATACGGQDQIEEKNMPLTNEEFDVKFLRPISITAKDNKGLVDAENAGASIALADVLQFADWRDEAFSPNGYNYFEYYGIESISLDESAVTTTLNGGTLGKDGLTDGGTLLTSKYDIKLTFTEAIGNISLTNMGTLNYKNNGAVLGADFEIRLPIVVKYKWGEIRVKNIDVTVHPTKAQQD